VYHRASIALTVCLVSMSACAERTSEDRRAALVTEIERVVRETSPYTGRSTLDPRVMQAIATVPRHEFVAPELASYAYENRPLPIGEGQTISEPYIVALMTDLAEVDADSVVLEVGTGSGYQAAVLARLVKHVYTIEILEPLGRMARQVLERLDYDNVSVRIGDGYAGWPEAAPFDAILVTAAPETVPQPLLDQLRTGGRLVVPVGEEGAEQSLQVIEKGADGTLTTTDVLPVMFVPFTRDNDA
jgi:protein-L-isoaspartate(D-aspartate) O-methyltransferase